MSNLTADPGVRTDLQVDANRADCTLYRLLCQLETMYERHRDAQGALGQALKSLRGARMPLRALMHTADRESTRGY